jgi:phosphopantetheinyl transferase (holo-ACP synthase)
LYKLHKISENISVGVLQLPDFAGQRGITAKRDQERQGSLFLLEQLFNKPVRLKYSAEGKPAVEGESAHISISHSHDKLAIIKNDKQATGIDIELVRDKVLKVRDKFLCEEELEATGTDVEKLILYWAAKEALYKLYGMKEVEFAKHLYIENLEVKAEGNFRGHIRLERFHKKFLLHYEKLEDYMLVYILHEIE